MLRGETVSTGVSTGSTRGSPLHARARQASSPGVVLSKRVQDNMNDIYPAMRALHRAGMPAVGLTPAGQSPGRCVPWLARG